MTDAIRPRPPAPPTVAGATPTVRVDLAAAVRRARGLVAVPARLAGAAGWTAYDTVARWPKTTAALTAALTAVTPVTVREVAGVVVAGSCACGSAYFGGAASRVRLASLPKLSSYRKRRRRIRRRWVTVMASAGMVAALVEGGPYKRAPRIRRIRRTVLGVRVLVDGAPVAAGPEDFRAKANRLRHGFGCRDVQVSDAGGLVDVHLMWDNPFANIIRAADLPPARRAGHVTVGIGEDGQPVAKDLRLPNLIVGAQGSGKSSELWTILDQLQRAGVPHRVRAFDPKGGIELADLADAAWYYESDPTRWDVFVQRAIRALEGRMAAMRAAGLRKAPISEKWPLDLMVVDELVTALALAGAGSKVKVGGRTLTADKAFMVYLSQARAAGHSVVALTQLGTKDVVGPVRGLFGHATCLRVGPTEVDLVDVVLGASAHKAYPAHLLPADGSAAGIGWMRTSAGVVKYRAGFTTDTERRAVAARMRAATTRMRQQSTDEGDDQ